MVAIDYKDAQTNISWVYLAKIFAFVLKENKAFIEAARKDLEEEFVNTISSTNVWKFFTEENLLYFQCVETILSKGFQDNEFINYDDQTAQQSATQLSQNRKRSRDKVSTIPKPHGNLRMTTRRVVNYVCRAPIHNKGIFYLQTITILKALFKIWPNLEFFLPTIFQLSRFLERTKHKTKNRPAADVNMREMKIKAENTRGDRVYSAMRRTWHGNLLKFPSLRDINQILSSWRNEEKAKQTTIESFSVEHSYHMERLREDISGWKNIIENNIWPGVWNAGDSLLKDTHRESIVRISNSAIGAGINPKHSENGKQRQNRITTLKNDSSYTVKKLKQMCADANVIYVGKANRIGLIIALADKEFSTTEPISPSTGIHVLSTRAAAVILQLMPSYLECVVVYILREIWMPWVCICLCVSPLRL
jgi:hypothetical protein